MYRKDGIANLDVITLVAKVFVVDIARVSMFVCAHICVCVRTCVCVYTCIRVNELSLIFP